MGVKRRKRTLFGVLARLDWIQILQTAIQNRRASWSENPVREWRNASDEVFAAVIQALRKKRIDPLKCYIEEHKTTRGKRVCNFDSNVKRR